MKKWLLVLTILSLMIPYNTKAIETSARCAILMDTDTNRILYANNIHEVRSVASISKIMTALLAVESGKLDDTVTIGDEILDAYGSAIYIKQGEEMTLRDLVYGLMLRSGNDAALAIAKYVGGNVQTFVEMMNKKASEIGMKNTTFNNPSGLDEDKGNMSTAYDMAILTSYAMHNEDYKTIVKTKNHKVTTNKNAYAWTNKNKLLTTYKYTTGGKTGYTEIARRTLVSTASKNGLNLVVVTLNDGNDFLDHKALHEYGFQNYTNYLLLQEGNVSIYDETYYKDEELYLKNNFSYPLLESEKDTIKLKFELEQKKNFNNDEPIGKVKVFIGDKEIHTDDVFVKEKIAPKKLNIFQKIGKWFKNLW